VSDLEFVALVLAAIGPLLALAKLARVPQLFLLAGAGLGSAFLPGLLGSVLERSEADALGASLATVATYVLMAAVLAVRPRGLFPAGA